MKVFYTIKELQDILLADIKAGKTIGLVPTMGALHEGHISLVEKCVSDNDITVVSIFVNPTQFNDKKDLVSYPRTLDKDCALLENCGTNYVFAPSEAEMYPEPDTRKFEFEGISNIMEGAHRPGHFNGVCQIVSHLFHIVNPQKAYFGEKDWQQIMVIKALVKYLDLNVNIIECPIIREENGLAKSSRNALLTTEERNIAANIYKILKESKRDINNNTVAETHKYVVEKINSIPQLKVEYLSIVNGNTLKNVISWDDSNYIVGCITVFCGTKPVRLIDHIKYKDI